MTGYVRQDTTNQIANGNTVDAVYLDQEFDGVEAAFSAATGHVHDGTLGNGAPITKVGPAQDVVVSATTVLPKTDNTLDLGSTTFEWKDLWVDGVANIDSLVADTADINGGTIDATVIGATTPAAATITALVANTGTVGGVPIVTTTATQTLTGKTVDLTNNTLVATSAQLRAAVTDETGTGNLVFAADPAFTGTPTAPTAAAGTNTTQLATTAHVFAERTNTSTLTNKTLTSPTINTPTISGGTITGITDLAVADGGTGSSTGAGAVANFGITATITELNRLSGVTSAIQTQIDNKQPLNAKLTEVAGGSFKMLDNQSITFGTGDDFTIVHDGANTYLTEAGTGPLVIRTSGLTVQSPLGDETILTAAQDGAIVLYHDNVSRLATATTGVQIEGIMTGGVIATTGEAQGGVTAGKLLDTVKGKALIDAVVPGIGQGWQDFTASRAANTTYQNTSGKEIEVKVGTNVATGGATFNVGATAGTLIQVSGTTTGGGTAVQQTNGGSVPAGHFYQYTGTIAFWREKRA